MDREEFPELPIAIMGFFCFGAGFVYALCFIAMCGVQIVNESSNVVSIGIAPIKTSIGLSFKFVCFPIFLAAVALTGFLVKGKDHSETLLLRGAGIQIVALLALMVIGFFSSPLEHGDSIKAIVLAGVGAVAAGVQNALLYAALPAEGRASVAQLVFDAIKGLSSNSIEDREAATMRSEYSWPRSLNISFGLVCGAIGYILFSFWSLIFPIVMTIALAFFSAGSATRMGRHFP